MEAKYVAGFLFSEDGTNVALIHKVKPDWQKGLFNAIGGKIEDGENRAFAMSREFEEETGVAIAPERWREYCQLTDRRNYIVSFFFTFSTYGELGLIRQIEEEVPHVWPVCDLPKSVIPNLRWLIPMALEMGNERAESFTVIES